jgi:hypothetical protein
MKNTKVWIGNLFFKISLWLWELGERDFIEGLYLKYELEDNDKNA